MRTEERLEIARAKSNYWRRHRSQKEVVDEMEEEAWMTIKEGILVLEEREGEWIKEEDDIRLLKDRDYKKLELKSPVTNLSIMRREKPEGWRKEPRTSKRSHQYQNMHPSHPVRKKSARRVSQVKVCQG